MRWFRAALMLAMVTAWVSVTRGDPRVAVVATTAGGPGNIALASAVSQTFLDQTHAATRSVPQRVWDTVEAAGWRVQLAEFVVDAAPDLRGVTPRGWPAEMTWDNSDALNLPTSRLLIVAEKRRSRQGDVVTSNRVAGVLRHELGHAFDLSGGQGHLLSSTTSFRVAYQRDVAAMDADARRQLAYFLQSGAPGRQETFAEAFAVLYGGGSSEIELEQFRRAFPYTLRAVWTTIETPRAAVPPSPRPETVVQPSTPQAVISARPSAPTRRSRWRRR